MVVREPDFTCAKTVSDKLKDYDNIETIFETEIIEAGGEQALKYAVFQNNVTRKTVALSMHPGQYIWNFCVCRICAQYGVDTRMHRAQ